MCLSFAVNIRNLAMEKVAEQVEFPCRFSGCTALMMAGDKTKHEVFCDFRFVFRSTPQSQPNKVGLKCPSVRPSVRPQKLSLISVKFGM